MFLHAIFFLIGVSAATAAVEPLRIDGLVAAVFTPFDRLSGALNLSVVPEQEKYLNATGVDYVFVGGTTGESLSLTVDERKQLAEAWMATSANVIVHVGAEAVSDARELASHAERIGALAIGAMPPVFFSPANAQALALTISAICSAAASLPCYYYHIPSQTHYEQPMYDLILAIEELGGIDNFAGIKYTGLYTNPGYMDAQRVLEYKDGKYEVLAGREEMMLQSLSIGIKGHIGSQFNVAGDLYNAIRTTYEAEGLTRANEDKLRLMQSTGLALIAAWADPSPAGVNGNKVFMNLAGVEVGDGRLPTIPADDDTIIDMRTSFSDFCKSSDLSQKLHMCN